jgi:NTE family protein
VRFGLVLGAGGVVGMSYHAGVLHALSEVGGLDPASADLIVGTSAGSVMGALLRSGWTAADCWAFSLEEHPVVSELDDAERRRRERAMFSARRETPAAMARRVLGSSYVLARSAVRGPAPKVPGFLAKRFPAGIFENGETRERLAEVLPEAWPAKDYWAVAVDVSTGRRVVLGRHGAPETTLRTGVLSSCAIPGIYPPVRVGRKLLVDGGAHSSTHLDLAARAGCDLVIGVAPMAFDPASPPSGITRLARQVPTRSLAREARIARRQGATVLLVRPTGDEVRLHGRDMMRPSDTGVIARAAYEHAARLLDTPRFRRVLACRADIAAA